MKIKNEDLVKALKLVRNSLTDNGVDSEVSSINELNSKFTGIRSLFYPDYDSEQPKLFISENRLWLGTELHKEQLLVKLYMDKKYNISTTLGDISDTYARLSSASLESVFRLIDKINKLGEIKIYLKKMLNLDLILKDRSKCLENGTLFNIVDQTI